MLHCVMLLLHTRIAYMRHDNIRRFSELSHPYHHRGPFRVTMHLFFRKIYKSFQKSQHGLLFKRSPCLCARRRRYTHYVRGDILLHSSVFPSVSGLLFDMCIFRHHFSLSLCRFGISCCFFLFVSLVQLEPFHIHDSRFCMWYPAFGWLSVRFNFIAMNLRRILFLLLPCDEIVR